LEKIFCDFCQNEIKTGDECKLRIEEPPSHETVGYVSHREFDVCTECLKKIRAAIGVK